MLEQRCLWLSLPMLLGCAASAGSGPRPGDRNLLTAEEIASVRATHALDIIRQLRPTWLRGRGPVSMRNSTPDYPVIYVDGVRAGTPDILERIPAVTVLDIRFLSGRDATTLYGLDHSGGAILLRTRHRPRAASPPGGGKPPPTPRRTPGRTGRP